MCLFACGVCIEPRSEELDEGERAGIEGRGEVVLSQLDDLIGLSIISVIVVMIMIMIVITMSTHQERREQKSREKKNRKKRQRLHDEDRNRTEEKGKRRGEKMTGE